MARKFIITPLLVLTGTAAFVLFLLVFTPVPYIPINHLLSNSSEMSGHMTGTLNSGVCIDNFVIKGQPEGEVSIQKMVFKYSGLWDYFVRDRMIVRDLRWEGVRVNLPQGNFTNWSELEKRMKDETYLMLPLKNDDVNFIQIDNFIFKDVDVHLGKKQGGPGFPIPGFPASPALMGLATPSGMAPPNPAKPKVTPVMKVVHFEMANQRYTTFQSTRTMVLTSMVVDDFLVDKADFHLGRLAMKSDLMDLEIGKLEPGQGNPDATHFIRGAYKASPTSNIKKDIGINGSFAWMKFLDLSIYDGKMSLKVSEKTPGNPFPNVECHITGLNPQDYYRQTAPLTNVTYDFRLSELMSMRLKPVLYFNLGRSRFGSTSGPKDYQALMTETEKPVPVLYAGHDTEREITATLLIDRKIPGRVLVELNTIPPSENHKELLSHVWYQKDTSRLTMSERSFLRTEAASFFLSPDEFNEPKRKMVAARHPRRRGRR